MKLVATFLIAAMIAGVSLVGLASAQTAHAATFSNSDSCTKSFLGFPTWYNHLPKKSGSCDIDFPSGSSSSNLSGFIFTIVLNVIEIALRVIGFAAVGFIIYGGFKYLTSAGSADKITSGRKIITNAVVGLIISFLSVAIVNLVGANIEGSNAASSCAAASGDVAVDADCVGIAKVKADNAIKGVLNTAYYAAGITAVIVIIISAIFYTTSQGDASKTKRAKDGILYAIVGLVIVMFAFVITNFVIGRF
jgi:hypothetical protein